MPSDNLENLFKQKVLEGQHTPPPFGWDKEASWQKLQPTLLPNREKRLIRYYYGVAASIILLLSVAIVFFSLKNQPAEELVATSTKVEKSVPTTKPGLNKNIPKPEPNADLKSDHYAANTQAIVVNKKRVRKNRKVLERQIAVHKIEIASSRADGIFTELPKSELPNNLESEQTVVAPTPIAKPIKITIVLGARSIAKIDSAGKKTHAIAKNKLRLKMNLPGAEAAEYNQMVTNNSHHKPLVWETKIKL